MGFGEKWSEWWRSFLGFSQDKSRKAVDVLRQRYIEEMQQADRFKGYAEKMHYPQFNAKLHAIANEKGRHAEQIAEKLVALGCKLPAVPENPSSNENSWGQLLNALDEEYRSADDLVDQLRGILSDRPDITELLQQISQEQKKHRDEIREMLMRSDPFALSLS
ncbi:MAG TPA: ferritin-like domain-containing protein [Candidatus Binatia bacterium]|nr:ferritin-like domain-containing protein [Candidatus Binatia bacterium]